MNEESQKQDQLLETTDYLEAVGTLKCVKNFFFFLSLICLLVLQSCFWLMNSGYVDTDGRAITGKTDPSAGQILKLAVPADQNRPGQSVIAESAKSSQIKKAAADLTGESNAVVKPKVSEPLRIKFAQIEWPVRFCNFVLIISTLIYSLALLLAMKVSIIGRLGGISHITKAFFVSLFTLAFLLPWQLMFQGVIYGAIYTPSELLARCGKGGSTLGEILLFGRFTGLWFITIVLLIMAQLRSMRWARNILKRLGIAS